MARVHFAGVIEDDSYADVPVTEHLSTARRRDSHGSKDGKQEPEFIFCDWDQKELDAVRRCGLKYTIRRYALVYLYVDRRRG